MTTGDDRAKGTAVFHTTFLVALNSVGSAKPSATPAPLGPRNCSHSFVRVDDFGSEVFVLCCAYVDEPATTANVTATVNSGSVLLTFVFFISSENNPAAD